MDYRVDALFGPLVRMLWSDPLMIDVADHGRLAHTDGRWLFVSAASSEADRRLEIVVQCALLAMGSLAPAVVRTLLGKVQRTQRYLLLEVNRISQISESPWGLLPWSQLSIPTTINSCDVFESLELSRDASLPIAQDTRFGELRPSRILAHGGGWHRGLLSRREIERLPTSVDNDPELSEETESQDLPKLLGLFNAGLNIPNPVAELFRKVLGTRSTGRSEQHAGAEIPTRGVRAGTGPPHGLPTNRYRFTSGDKDTRAPILEGRWLYPEWDAQHRRIRPQWCTVHELRPAPQRGLRECATPARDFALEHGMSRMAQPRPRRRERLGDEFDLDAVVDTVANELAARRIDRLCDRSEPPVYIAPRRRQPDLGALVLVDVSGSTSDDAVTADAVSHSVLREQTATATALAQALHHVGHRVAVIGFNSDGRDDCRALVLRSFANRSIQNTVRALSALRPSQYSRLGAGIRHSCARLIAEAGTSRKLLVVLSDGVPYEAGYAGTYAVEDVAHAIDGCTANGVAVTWVCHGAMDPALQDLLAARPLVLDSSATYEQLRRNLPKLVARAVNLVTTDTGAHVRRTRSQLSP